MARRHRLSLQTVSAMTVYLNDKALDLAPGTTLEHMLAAQGLDGPGVAAAVDGRAVRRPDRAACILTDGCKVVVFKAVCGG